MKFTTKNKTSTIENEYIVYCHREENFTMSVWAKSIFDATTKTKAMTKSYKNVEVVGIRKMNSL